MMIRKWLTSLMALLLCLMLPLCAMADVQHTFTLIPGDELKAVPAVADLLDVLSITYVQGDESGELMLGLGGEEVVSAAVKADPIGLYTRCSLLGEDVLYITWEDGMAVLSDLLKGFLAAEGGLNEESAQALDTALNEFKTALTAVGTGAAAPAAVQNVEETVAMAEQLFADDPAMIAYVRSVAEKITMQEGIFETEGRDAADGSFSLSLGSEDFLGLCETNYLRNTIAQTLQAENAGLSENELTAAVNAALEETREIFRTADIIVSVNVATVDEGQTPVGMDLVMTFAMEQGSLGMTARYDRLTDPNCVSHKASADMRIDGEEALDVLFDLRRNADGTTNGLLGMLAYGEEILLDYDAINLGDSRTRTAKLYIRSDASAIVEPAASDRPLLGLRIVTEPVDEAVLESIETATAATATDLMKMSEEEMNALVSQAEMNLYSALAVVLSKLPASVMEMMTGMMQ